MARSHEATSWQPAAAANPFTTAMTGIGSDAKLLRVSEHNVKIAYALSLLPSYFRSWPEENTVP